MPRPALRLGPLPPIQVSPGTLITVLLLAAMIFPSMAVPGASLALAASLAVGVALVLILSVLLHEAAHAVAAHLSGATVDHIALTLWGGHTQYRGAPLGALSSIVVSLVGPLSNLLLAGLAHLAARSVESEAALAFWSACSLLNLALAVFNLLPGLPMDGGRALEALLGGVLRSPVRGTVITAWIGRGIAVLVLGVPLWRILEAGGTGTLGLLTLLWALLIAGMLWRGASSALNGARLQRRIEGLDLAALARPIRLVPPTQPLGALDVDPEDVLVLEPGTARPGVLGRVRRLDEVALAAVPAEHRERTPVSAVAAPLGELGVLPSALGGEQLVSAMMRRPAPAYAVLDAEQRMLGVVLAADVQRRLGAPRRP